jgi:hypothetical protein
MGGMEPFKMDTSVINLSSKRSLQVERLHERYRSDPVRLQRTPPECRFVLYGMMDGAERAAWGHAAYRRIQSAVRNGQNCRPGFRRRHSQGCMRHKQGRLFGSSGYFLNKSECVPRRSNMMRVSSVL